MEDCVVEVDLTLNLVLWKQHHFDSFVFLYLRFNVIKGCKLNDLNKDTLFFGPLALLRCQLSVTVAEWLTGLQEVNGSSVQLFELLWRVAPTLNFI